MRRVTRFAPAEIMPGNEDVLARLQMPRHAAVPPPLRALFDEAAIRLQRWVDARGVVVDVTPAEFLTMYNGEGPLDEIVPRSQGLAVFAGTLGSRISDDVQALFGAGDPALAMTLDAFASEAANRLAYALAAGLKAEGVHVLPYSPGYCGWPVTGQRALFFALQPEDIGLKLNASDLMTPLKSVSGLLVAGDEITHRFRPTYAFCDECSTHECVQRMASVRR